MDCGINQEIEGAMAISKDNKNDVKNFYKKSKEKKREDILEKFRSKN